MTIATAAHDDDRDEDDDGEAGGTDGGGQYDATAADENDRAWFDQFRGFLVERVGVFGGCRGSMHALPDPLAREIGPDVAAAERKAVIAAYRAIESLANQFVPPEADRPSVLDLLRPRGN